MSPHKLELLVLKAKQRISTLVDDHVAVYLKEIEFMAWAYTQQSNKRFEHTTWKRRSEGQRKRRRRERGA